MEAKAVDFLLMEEEELQRKEALELYPPRLTVQVGGSSAVRSSVLRLHFTGCQRAFHMEILLEKGVLNSVAECMATHYIALWI